MLHLVSVLVFMVAMAMSAPASAKPCAPSKNPSSEGLSSAFLCSGFSQNVKRPPTAGVIEMPSRPNLCGAYCREPQSPPRRSKGSR